MTALCLTTTVAQLIVADRHRDLTEAAFANYIAVFTVVTRMDDGTVVSAKHTQLIIHLHLCPCTMMTQQLILTLILRLLLTTATVITLINHRLLGELQQHGCKYNTHRNLKNGS